MRRRQTKKPLRPFTVVWEFRVKHAKRSIFEKVYGPDGDWAQLFRSSPDYLGTELLRDRDGPLRYVTLDHWTSKRAYLRFKKENLEAYKALDAECGALTTRERLLGEFDEIGSRQFLADTPIRQEPCGADTLVRAGLDQNITGGQECPPHITSAGIRPAAPYDVPAIVALERKSPSAAHWPEPVYQNIFSQEAPTRIAFVIARDRALQGFVIARLSGEDCELENIVIERDQQRNGLGTTLIRNLIHAAKAKNATRIFLEVRESNASARALYEKNGFFLSGRRRAYYANPTEDAVLYTFEL